MKFICGLMAACAAVNAVAGGAAGTNAEHRSLDLGGFVRPILFASLEPVQASPKSHTVIEGDNDWKISRQYGITPAELHEANPGVNWRALQIGKKLHIPGSADNPVVSTGDTHTVKKGDNDHSISKSYGVTVAALHEANPNVDWRALKIGSKLSVPGAVAKATTVSRISTERVKTKFEGVRVRREPSTSAGTIVSVDKGTVATVLGTSGDWYELRFPKGTTGWVRGDMLTAYKSATPSAQLVASSPIDSTIAEQLVTSAKSMLGVRYKWGGTSRGGVDCSGFTSVVFSKVGIKLPRTSIEQSRIGERVSKFDLQTGDLLFFVTGRNSRRINHVGMYVGDGKFIHASSYRHRVIVTDLKDYSSAYAGARRLKQLAATPTLIEDVIDVATAAPVAPKADELFPTRVVAGADKTLR